MKKVLMINGSPRKKKSSSLEYIRAIRKLLVNEWECDIIDTPSFRETRLLEDLSVYTDLFFVLPLYVDSVPANLTAWLEDVERKFKGVTKGLNVRALVNSGFWEGHQNRAALEIIENFCRRMDFIWKGGAGIGAGALIQPMMKMPKAAKMRQPVTEVFKSIADEMRAESGEPGSSPELTGTEPVVRFTQFNMSWFMYKLGGQIGWRTQARKNGLKRRDIDARPYA